MRRIRLSDGQITSIGVLGLDPQIDNVEAITINGTTRPFTLYAINGDVLGSLDFNGIDPVIISFLFCFVLFCFVFFLLLLLFLIFLKKQQLIFL